MGAVRGVEPRRLALRYEPPGIIVEYVYQSNRGRQLYHHEIDLKAELSLGSGRFSEYRIEGLVHDIIKQHEEVVGGSKVSSTQLARLVRKLVDHQHSASESAPSSAQTILPQADYNRVSETQLKQVKQKMDLVFEQNIVRPDQEGYQYDKQVDFQAATEASDWDD